MPVTDSLVVPNLETENHGFLLGQPTISLLDFSCSQFSFPDQFQAGNIHEWQIIDEQITPSNSARADATTACHGR